MRYWKEEDGLICPMEIWVKAGFKPIPGFLYVIIRKKVV